MATIPETFLVLSRSGTRMMEAEGRDLSPKGVADVSIAGVGPSFNVNSAPFSITRRLHWPGLPSRVGGGPSTRWMASQARLLDERIEALLRIALGHLDGGLDGHHRTRGLMDD